MATDDKTRHYALSEKDNWETPCETVEEFADALGCIHLDPCASPNTEHGDVANYRLEDDQDGLQLPWFGNVFINPPFSFKVEWLEKLIEELEAGRVDTAVMILPDGTDTISWWHEYVAKHAEYVCFREGRLNYVDPVESYKEEFEQGNITRKVFSDKVEEYLDDDMTPSDVLAGDYDTPGATFGTAFVVFGDPPDELLQTLDEKGHLVKTVKT